MSRLNDIIREDSEMLEKGVVDEWERIVTLKLAQISSTLAMIFDLEKEGYHRETSDDGR